MRLCFPYHLPPLEGLAVAPEGVYACPTLNAEEGQRPACLSCCVKHQEEGVNAPFKYNKDADCAVNFRADPRGARARGPNLQPIMMGAVVGIG